MSIPSRTATTFRYERWRAVSNGVLETAGSTFLLLIAVRYFAEAGAAAKGLIAGGGSLGLLLTPLVVGLARRTGWPVAKTAAVFAAIGSLIFVLMAALPFLPVYVAGSVFAMAAASSVIPLLTQIYQENYPENRRGQFFAQAVMIRIGVAAAFSELAGRILSSQEQGFLWLLLVFAAAFAFTAYCLSRCPSNPLQTREAGSLSGAVQLVRQDRLFRHTLICWMLMGFANLMMLPMRVEYLANPRYGLAMSATEIAFLVGVLPNAARLMVSPLWGWLFDRMNFFRLRVTLNFGFAIGIVAFFTSGTLTGLAVGSLVYGISNAGGDVAWGLWVTKLAPPDRVADYMAVHTFLTGVRGVVAPLVAFHLVQVGNVGAVAWLCAGLIGLASILLLPEINRSRVSPNRPTLLEEVSE